MSSAEPQDEVLQDPGKSVLQQQRRIRLRGRLRIWLLDGNVHDGHDEFGWHDGSCAVHQRASGTGPRAGAQHVIF